MPREKAAKNPSKQDQKTKTPRDATEKPTLQAALQVQEEGTQTHLRALKTRKTYAGHVQRARQWVKVHLLTEAGTTVPDDFPQADKGAEEISNDPTFPLAFEVTPNKWSAKATTLYLSWLVFRGNKKKGTAEGVRAALLMQWNEADGDTYRGPWHYSEVRHRWEGNPIRSGMVDDVMAAIKNKSNAEGAVRTHSAAMSKEYMEMMHTWSRSICDLDLPIQFIQLAMTGSVVPPPGKVLYLDERTVITRHLEQIAFCSTAWTIWTRNSELTKLRRRDIEIASASAVDAIFVKYLQGEERSLTYGELHTYFEVYLRNRKGWQTKMDRGMRELLRCNYYKIYPKPKEGAGCDAFLWLLLWIKWVEVLHLGRPMAQDDYVFPAVGANGVLQPGSQLGHDTVQKWITEATEGAGVFKNFTTHCFRRGGAQHRFLYAPTGQRWSLDVIQWWGGWAEGEQHGTLMRYVLDELYHYEHDHSDALAPTSREAGQSLAGEAALVRPATTEALNTVQASLSAEIQAAFSKLSAAQLALTEGQLALAKDIRSLHEQLGGGSNHLQPPDSRTPTSASTSASLSNPSQIQPGQIVTVNGSASQSVPTFSWQAERCTPETGSRSHSHSHSHSRSHAPVLPTQVPPQGSVARHAKSWSNARARRSAAELGPTPGLVIPKLPIDLPDGTPAPKSQSWKDLVRHWTEGEPRLGLHTPLKDWPREHYNGRNRCFNEKFAQRRTIATEFLNEFERNETAFLEAYGPAASRGHTDLLHKIQDARRLYGGNGERRSRIALVHQIAAAPSTKARRRKKGPQPVAAAAGQSSE